MNSHPGWLTTPARKTCASSTRADRKGGLSPAWPTSINARVSVRLASCVPQFNRTRANAPTCTVYRRFFVRREAKKVAAFDRAHASWIDRFKCVQITSTAARRSVLRYAWQRLPACARAHEDERLLGLIKHAWLESGSVYGHRKITKDLRELGGRAAGIVCSG